MIQIFTTLVVVLLSLQASAFSAQPTRVKIRSVERGQVIQLVDNSKMDIPESKELETELVGPIQLNLRGRMPVILFPISSGDSEIKIDPPTYRTAAGEAGQVEINTMVSEILAGIQEVQNHIYKKNYDRALVKVEELQQQFPNVGFLNFTKGSILFLQGKKTQARKAVTKALEDLPNFQEGKDFLKALGGPINPSEGAGNE